MPWSGIIFKFLCPLFLGGFIFFSWLPFRIAVDAQTCDHTIGPEVEVANAASWGNYSDVRAGDTVCITPDPSGQRQRLTLENFNGEKDKRITFINHGGQVIINGGYEGALEVKRSEYWRLTGTGVPGVEYGFELTGSREHGFFGRKVSDFEIDHIEVHDVNMVGIHVHNPQLESGEVESGEEWSQNNTYIHDNYLHHCGTEGIYIGFGIDKRDPHLYGVEIAYNLIDTVGWDGIQVSNGRKDVRVHHNYIKDPAYKNEDDQNAGVSLGYKNSGDWWYNNMIINAGRDGMYILGDGGHRIFNNLFINSGHLNPWGEGIVWQSGSGLFYNNTIVNSRRHGLRAVAGGADKVIFDNIIVGSGSETFNIPETVTTYNNLIGAIDEAGFVDPDTNHPTEADFHLRADSPAVDSGSDSGYAPFDYDDIPRPQGSRSDLGAFEYLDNLFTFWEFFSVWQTVEESLWDLNSDGKINGIDFGMAVL